MIKIEGKISSIVFHNEENGFSVLKFLSGSEEIVAVGNIIRPAAGRSYLLEGEHRNHIKFGRQFAFSFYEEKPVRDSEAMEAFLASGQVHGIGPAFAKKIVDKFGDETFRIVLETPDRLLEISGLGQKKLESLVATLKTHETMAKTIAELQKIGISASLSARLFKVYDIEAVNVLKRNPYMLIDDNFGIGFKTADEIAVNLGFEKENLNRLEGAVKYIMAREVAMGHCFVTKEHLFMYLRDMLSVSSEVLEDALINLQLTGYVVVDDNDGEILVYLARYYEAENTIAKKLIELTLCQRKPIMMDLNDLIKRSEIDLDIEFSSEQKNAVIEAAQSGVIVVTGGPGTGKTTVVNGIISLLESAGLSTEICAPTGRAAKRVSEATGHFAKTIHRLLGYHFSEEDKRGVFLKDEENPIDADAVIVDEASMVDLLLMEKLLDAVKPHTRLILVGDVDQLPPVGAGFVLSDIIESQMVSVVKLKEIFRQAQESMIVVNAHSINKGEAPICNKNDSDFYFIAKESQREISNSIVELCSKRLPEHYNIKDPISSIQVLSPMKKGEVGVNNLNSMLQEILNPPSALKNEKKHGSRNFRLGDKVMQVKNNYDKEWLDDNWEEGIGVFNGDLGLISDIDIEDEYMSVDFYDGRKAEYDFSELDQLEMAYAITVHKSQGSEFPVVVMPISYVPKALGNRNLLYTAITRGKELVVLVGGKKELHSYLENVSVRNRNTLLATRIKNMNSVEILK